MKDERTPPRVRALLLEVPQVKAFGERKGLKPTSNYQEYVQLPRPAAVWVVSACRPLKFESKEWSFPLVGRFPYLGWFSREGAESFAEDLRKEGWDVDVRGAAAYSTLGWFRDAILSTMISRGEEALGELVNVVLHESVHATWYVDGQAFFNESLASFVADRLTSDYFSLAQGKDSPLFAAYLEAQKRGAGRVKKLHEAFVALDRIYADSALSDEVKLARKGEQLARLKTELGFQRELNNATLVQFKTYSTGFQEFERLLAHCGGDGRRFWKKMREVTSGHFPSSQAQELREVIAPLLRNVCGS